MTIQWDDELSIGLESVDNQHKELLKIVNELLTAVQQGMDRATLVEIFRRLSEYTVHHFISEEDVMQRIGYPKLREHQQEHEKLKRDVKDFQRKIFKQETIDPDELLAFIKSWLLEHILQHDREIARFTRTK